MVGPGVLSNVIFGKAPEVTPPVRGGVLQQRAPAQVPRRRLQLVDLLHLGGGNRTVLVRSAVRPHSARRTLGFVSVTVMLSQLFLASFTGILPLDSQPDGLPSPRAPARVPRR